MEIERPILRYFGGKWKLAPWIISHFPAHRVYVEPFGGAASVLLRKPRSYAEIYNDLDGEVVNLFRVYRDPAQAAELVRLLRLTPFAREEYLLAREFTDDPIEQARRLVIRAYMGFGTNGMNRHLKTGFRCNCNNQHTAPAEDWMHYPDFVPAMVERLQGVVIEHKDAAEVITHQDTPATLFYVDPPYVHDTRSIYQRKNYTGEMTDDDHRALAAQLHQVRGQVVLSGYRGDLYDELYGDWQREEHPSLADGNGKRVECIWINFTTRQMQLELE